MLKRLLAMVVISGFALSSASAQMSLEEKEFKLINTSIAAQIYIAMKEGQSARYNFPDLKVTELPKISAQTIADEFDENNLAADSKYKYLSFVLIGKIAEIRNRKENIRIVLDTSNNKHGDMYADMDTSLSSFAKLYKKGAEINLVCEGVEYDLIAKAIKCAPEGISGLIVERQAETITKAFLSGQNIDKLILMKNGNTASPSLFVLKYSAKFVPDDSPCMNFYEYSKCDYRSFIPNNGKASSTPEYKEDYQKNKQRYHLP